MKSTPEYQPRSSFSLSDRMEEDVLIGIINFGTLTLEMVWRGMGRSKAGYIEYYKVVR